MANKKYHYYIGVHTDKGLMLVTEFHNSEKTAFWNADEKPIEFTKNIAYSTAECLCLNQYPAFVITSFYELRRQIFANK